MKDGLAQMIKKSIGILLLTIIVCLFLTSCGADKRPIDMPSSTWVCETNGISFSVTDDCKITDATMTDINGNVIPISFVFTEVEEGGVTITNIDQTEIYIKGTCTYKRNKFSIFISDIYISDYLNLDTIRLIFNRI